MWREQHDDERHRRRVSHTGLLLLIVIGNTRGWNIVITTSTSFIHDLSASGQVESAPVSDFWRAAAEMRRDDSGGLPLSSVTKCRLTNSHRRRAYCSAQVNSSEYPHPPGSTVLNSASAPYLTVLAAVAVRFFTP